MGTVTNIFNYRCSNDCVIEGCPSHKLTLTYQSTAETFSITTDNEPPIWLDVNLLPFLITFITDHIYQPKNNDALISQEQWLDDCETMLTACQYGNPPGGWSDPVRIREFQEKLYNIEKRMRAMKEKPTSVVLDPGYIYGNG